MVAKSPEPAESPQTEAAVPPVHHSRANKVVVILLLMAVILVGGWLLLSGDDNKKETNKLGEFSQRTLKTGGYAYSFEFTKDSKEVKKEADGASVSYLEGKADKGGVTLSLTAQPVEWPVIEDCNIIANDFKEAFTFEVSGKPYKVCQLNNISYVTVFESDNQRHQVSISSSDSKTPVDDSTVKNILSSLKISKS